jgi:hypothetical protein
MSAASKACQQLIKLSAASNSKACHSLAAVGVGDSQELSAAGKACQQLVKHVTHLLQLELEIQKNCSQWTLE